MPVFRQIRNKLADKLEIPEDSICSVFRLQIIGNTAILCGCKKILKYNSEEISALAKDAVVTFLGIHLKCVYFFESTLEINGEIKGVSIDKK